MVISSSGTQLVYEVFNTQHTNAFDAHEEIVVPEKVMRAVCDNLARAKDRTLVEEDLRKMMVRTSSFHVCHRIAYRMTT